MSMSVRAKTLTCRAIQWTGKNLLEVMGFCNGARTYHLRLSGRTLYLKGANSEEVSISEGDYLIWNSNDQIIVTGQQSFAKCYEVVEANGKPLRELKFIQYVGNNIKELLDFVGSQLLIKVQSGEMSLADWIRLNDTHTTDIHTLSVYYMGNSIKLAINDFVVKGSDGVCVPVTKAFFQKNFPNISV